MAKTSKTCDVCGANFTPRTSQKRCSKACKQEAIRQRQRQQYKANPEKPREASRRWHHANKEKALEKNRRWEAANREKKREHRRRSYHANLEKNREAVRRYHKANKEKVKETQRQWYEANREKTRETSRRRYHLMGGDSYRVHWRFLLERDGPTCQLCGGALDPHTEPFHVDHILPVSKGGGNDPENLQLAHPSCNKSKGDRVDFDAVQLPAPAMQLSLFE